MITTYDLEKLRQELLTDPNIPSNHPILYQAIERIDLEIQEGNKDIMSVVGSGNKNHLIQTLEKLESLREIRGGMIKGLGY